MKAVDHNNRLTHHSAFGVLVLGLLVLVLLLVFQLYQGREAALERATNDATNLALTLDGQLTSTLRRMESTLQAVSRQLPAQVLNAREAAQHRQRVHDILAPLTRDFPEILGLFVWDQHGDILYDTVSKFPLKSPYSIAQRPGFQALQSSNDATITFSDAIRSTLTGHQTVAMYAPLRDAHGQLRGVVSATLNLDRVAQLFQSLRLGGRSVVFIRSTNDHKLVIRYPSKDMDINSPIRNAIQQRIDAGQWVGSDRFKAVTDGEYRLYSYRKLEGYPFYVVVGISQSDVLSAWHRNALFMLTALFALALALTLALWRLRWMNQHREAALREARQANVLLQDAINSLPAGLIIYDRHDRFVMCNEAQRQIFPDLVDQFVPGNSFAEILNKGIQRGVFASAVGHESEWYADSLKVHRRCAGEVYEQPLRNGRWLQISEYRTPSGYTVGNRLDITERKRLEDDLREQAMLDALTGLPNRWHFMRRLKEEIARVQRLTTPQATVLRLELDDFLRIHEVQGAAAGEQLLRFFADLLREQLRMSDSCGHLGEQAFALVLPGTDLVSAQQFVQRLRHWLTQRPLTQGNAGARLLLTISVGITCIEREDTDAETILARAAACAQQARSTGGNRMVVNGTPV